MARIARLVAPGIPHHITQRGNRRQETFFQEDDYRAYISFLGEWSRRCAVQIWAYCLMPNHVHLIAVPGSEDGLRRAIGEAHKKYSQRVNSRENWQGHLWQGRFLSFPVDDHYLLVTARYVEMNPVRAHLVNAPEDYPWSSAQAHLNGYDDRLVKSKPLMDIAGDWNVFLRFPISGKELTDLRRHEKTGRPLGNANFVRQLEKDLNRKLVKQKPGPKSHKSYSKDGVAHVDKNPLGGIIRPSPIPGLS